MEREAPEVVLGEFAILPDRLRALLYLSAGSTEDTLASSLGTFIARSTAHLGLRGIALWDPTMECARIESPLELAVWQQRIRSARGVIPRSDPSGTTAKAGVGNGG